jgi:hypothetical protein
MITAVIPTVLKSDKPIFEYLLYHLNESEHIMKIVVIDNTFGEFKKQFQILNKCVVISDQNYKVNKAWNRGVKECDTPYYLLINDDILCHHTVIDKCVKVLEQNQNCGLLTVKTIKNVGIEEYNKLEIQNEMIIDKINGFYCGQPFGWFMIGKKSIWKNIESIDIFFGDNFIYDNTVQNKLDILRLESAVISHFESTSVSKVLGNNAHTKMMQELRAYNMITKRYQFQNEAMERMNRRNKKPSMPMQYPPKI